jgi:hypothetical protein
VGIHEMSADTVGLYGSQPFFMQNNWLPYYNDKLSYGAIGAGMSMRATDVIAADGTTRNNVYWVAKKYNGQGIFRFDRINRTTPVFTAKGIYTLQPVPGRGDLFIAGSYSGLSVFSFEPGNGLRFLGDIDG